MIDQDFLIELFDKKLRNLYDIENGVKIEATHHVSIRPGSLFVQYILPDEDVVIHTEYRVKKSTISNYPLS